MRRSFYNQRGANLDEFPILGCHCCMTFHTFIRQFVSIWSRRLPLQRPDIPHRKHQNPSEDVEDAIDQEFNDLLDQWRKLNSEILSELTERYEIGCKILCI